MTEEKTLDGWKRLKHGIWPYFIKKYPDTKQIRIKECGAEGDCMFHVLAKGINNFMGSTFTMQHLRDVTADQLSLKNLDEFLLACPQPKLSFVTKEAQILRLKKMIKTPGNTIWGEEGMLRYLLLPSFLFQQLGLGFCILTTSVYESHNKLVCFAQPIVNAKTKYVLFLYCKSNVHF